jgi:60 kDa SS-A/Ro ribonucleoprotein
MKTAKKTGRKSIQAATVVNYAGAEAYSMEAEAALAQLSVTGCFNNTYYTKAEDQLAQVLTFARQSHPLFVAKVAVYARESGFMKDMPAALISYLASRDPDLCAQVFPKVINNGKMLRNFAQMIRSGSFGRHNLSAQRIKKMVSAWFNSRTDEQIFFQSVGDKPTLGDIVKMARVAPTSAQRSALYAYLIGKKEGNFEGQSFTVSEAVPALVASYEAFKASPVGEIPNAPFEMLLGLQLSPEDWKSVATKATWFQTFRSLNTFARHDVFTDPKMVKLVVDKLTRKDLIEKANVFPYQIMTAYKAINEGSAWHKDEKKVDMPKEIGHALEEAMEVATANVPAFEGLEVAICTDVSGSMRSPVTGERAGSTTTVRCIDVAALISSALLRKNPHASVYPFEGCVRNDVTLNSNNSIMKNAGILAAVGGGATNCAAPLQAMNASNRKVDVVIFVSDYESWSHGDGMGRVYDSYLGQRRGPKPTTMAAEWEQLKTRNPSAKLVCIDVTPDTTTQVEDNVDVLHIGGFSDDVFKIMSAFVTGTGKGRWIETINQVQL